VRRAGQGQAGPAGPAGRAAPARPAAGRRTCVAAAGGILAFSLALAGAAAADAPCAPWPDEPAPLPTRDDPDALRAEWAALRVRELAAAARRLEERETLRARQLWRRVLCLDPGHAEARAGLERTPVVRLHRPALRDVPPDPEPPADPWAGLASPVGVYVDRSAEREEEARAAQLLALRRALAETRDQVQGARFDAALASADALRSRLAAAPDGTARRGLEAELEVLAATAQLALGREEGAQASLRRALEAELELALDPRATSPKVLRALERARAGDAP